MYVSKIVTLKSKNGKIIDSEEIVREFTTMDEK